MLPISHFLLILNEDQKQEAELLSLVIAVQKGRQR